MIFLRRQKTQRKQLEEWYQGDGNAPKKPHAFYLVSPPSLACWLFALEVEMLLHLQTERACFKQEEEGKDDGQRVPPYQLVGSCSFFMWEGKLQANFPCPLISQPWKKCSPPKQSMAERNEIPC